MLSHWLAKAALLRPLLPDERWAAAVRLAETALAGGQCRDRRVE